MYKIRIIEALCIQDRDPIIIRQERHSFNACWLQGAGDFQKFSVTCGEGVWEIFGLQGSWSFRDVLQNLGGD